MNKITKPLLVFTLLLMVVAGGWIFLSQYNNLRISEKICGGWNMYGENVCSCKGRYTKAKCPPNAICDKGNYYCSGVCGSCKCYKGPEKDGREVPCNNPSLD